MKVSAYILVAVSSLFLSFVKIKARSISEKVTGPCNEEVFENYLASFNKTGMYGDKNSDEYAIRCGAVTFNEAFINAHNNKSETNVTLKLNHESDWTIVEQRARNNLFFDMNAVPSKPSERVRLRRLSQHTENRRQLGSLPSSIDYTTTANPFGKIAVTSVKYQGKCASCWAFAANAVVEGQIALDSGESDMKSLSNQQIIDCIGYDPNTESSDSCNGGFTLGALNYIYAYGVTTADNYPSSTDTTVNKEPTSCEYNSYPPYATINYYNYLYPCDETYLMEALDTYGPIGVAIYMNTALYNHNSGIVTNADMGLADELSMYDCQNTAMPNHAVTLVGYGSDDGVDYWLLKNSYGTGWGDSGYFKLLRGAGLCGTACMSSQPVFAETTVMNPTSGELQQYMDDDWAFPLSSGYGAAMEDDDEPSNADINNGQLTKLQVGLICLACAVATAFTVLGAQRITKHRYQKVQHTSHLSSVQSTSYLNPVDSDQL